MLDGHDLCVHPGQDGLQYVLVFLPQDGAGRVNHLMPGGEQGQGLLQHGFLGGRGLRDPVGGHAALRLALGNEDRAGTGTGRVQQHLVELEQVAELAGVLAHDADALGALAVQVELEAFGADLVLLAGGDEGRIRRQRRHLRGLAAGGRRHVQDGFVLLGSHHQGRHHRGQGLQIHAAGFVLRQGLDGLFAHAAQDEGVSVPRHGLIGDARLVQHRADGGHIGLEGIHPQRHRAADKARDDLLGEGGAVLGIQAVKQQGRNGRQHGYGSFNCARACGSCAFSFGVG